jgi:hypothetical protein
MACLEHQCKESEYRAVITEATAAMVGTDDACRQRRPSATETAKASLEAEVAAQGEKVNTCHTDADCRCGDMPAWPTTWSVVDTGLRRVTTVREGGCEFRVTIDYNREYRERSAPCLKKPPPTTDPN